MQIISIGEMRSKLGKLEALNAAESQEIIITRHNKPLARLLPIRGTRPRPSHKALRDSLPCQEVSSEILQRQDREGR